MRALLTRVVALALALAALTLSGGVPAASAAPVFDPGTLFFIQTRATASGFVEIHTASAQSRYRSADLHTTTYFRTAEAAQGFFQMLGDDLWFVKVCQTGTGYWELHSATRASGYRSGSHGIVGGVAASASCSGAVAAVSQLGTIKLRGPLFTGIPVINFPQRLPSGAVVERWGFTNPSSMRLPYIGGRVLSDGQLPLLLHPTGTGSAPVDLSAYDSRYYDQPVVASPTWARRTGFRSGDVASGVADVRDVTGDGYVDLTLVKLYGTGSGHVEVFADDATRLGVGLGGIDLASATWFPASMASYGTWQLGSGDGISS